MESFGLSNFFLRAFSLFVKIKDDGRFVYFGFGVMCAFRLHNHLHSSCNGRHKQTHIVFIDMLCDPHKHIHSIQLFNFDLSFALNGLA